MSKKGEKDLAMADNGVPIIPHITENYLPLSLAIQNLVGFAYSQLQLTVETMPATQNTQIRKRKFLESLVKTRQQFVKAYVLCKWARNAADVSKCIDVVSWLHGQQNCYQNLVVVLHMMEQSLSGAKLRNPDLETALQVLRLGAPTQNSHNFIPQPKLSAATVLRTLQHLNVLLSIRLALLNDDPVSGLPLRFRNYVIANGRARFSVANAFDAELSVADDSVDARFFLVDFMFNFEGTPSQQVPPRLKATIERTANTKLDNNAPLSNMFQFLLKFTLNYKLSVVHRKLDLSTISGLWEGQISHIYQPDKSIINIYYWLTGTSNPATTKLNTIELALTNDIVVRWKRSTEETFQELDYDTLGINDVVDVEHLVTSILNKHSELLIDDIYKGLTREFTVAGDTPDRKLAADQTGSKPIDSPSVVTLLDPLSIKLKLNSSRSTIIAYDLITGRIKLSNTCPLVGAAMKEINKTPEKVTHVVSVLAGLVYNSLKEEVAFRAKTCGWEVLNSITLSSDAMKLHFETAKTLLFLRMTEWPFKWYLVVSVNKDLNIAHHLARIYSKERYGIVEYISSIFGGSPSVKFYKGLQQFVNIRISTQFICQQFDLAMIKHMFAADANGAPLLVANMEAHVRKWAHSAIRIRVFESYTECEGKLLHEMPISPLTDNIQLKKDGTFCIQIPLTDFVANLCRRLKQIQTVASFMSAITTMGLILLDSVSLDKFSFNYNTNLESQSPSTIATISLSHGEYPSHISPRTAMVQEAADGFIKVDKGDNPTAPTTTLEISPDSPHRIIQPLLQSLIQTSDLISVVWTLQSTLGLYESLTTISMLEAKQNFEFIVIPHSPIDLVTLWTRFNVKLSIKVLLKGYSKRSQKPIVFISTYDDNNASVSAEHFHTLKDLFGKKIDAVPSSIPLESGIVCSLADSGKMLTLIYDRLASTPFGLK